MTLKIKSADEYYDFCHYFPDSAASYIIELKEALRPFAEAAGEYPETKDSSELWEHPAAMDITMGHLRTAQKLLGDENEPKI